MAVQACMGEFCLFLFYFHIKICNLIINYGVCKFCIEYCVLLPLPGSVYICVCWCISLSLWVSAIFRWSHQFIQSALMMS